MIKLRDLFTEGKMSNLTKQKIVYVAALLVATALVGSAGYSLAIGDGVAPPQSAPKSSMAASPVNMQVAESSQGMESSIPESVGVASDTNIGAAMPTSSMANKPTGNGNNRVEVIPDNKSNSHSNTPINTAPTTNTPTPPSNNTGTTPSSMPAMSMDQVMELPMEQAMEMMNEMNMDMSLSEMPSMQQGMQNTLPQFNMNGSTTTNQTMHMSGM